jgi:hypothetical protein
MAGTGMRDGLTQPPKNATEFGGHEGMAEDWAPYGHTEEVAPAKEKLRPIYQESPDPAPGVNTI